MTSALIGWGGWVLATMGILATTITWVRFQRHTEAVARAAHEVRGPLTAVRLGLELRQLSGARLRAIELELGRATVALDDLSRTRISPAIGVEIVDVDELVGSSVEAWRAVAAAQGITVDFRPPERSLLVIGDRLRLAQAIGNLLANAIEHGRGGVEVSLLAGNGLVRLEVVDGGPGLPVAIDQLVRRRHRRRGERGHGLRVVSQVAAAHGGRLGSAPSETGARIVLELPAAGPDAVNTAIGRTM